MRLDPQDISTVNASLALIGAWGGRAIEGENAVVSDSKYANAFIDAYVAKAGLGEILEDSLLSQSDCVCGVTCSTPCASNMTGVGT